MARFPRSPDVGGRPFEDGNNPFADEPENGEPNPQPPSDNPLSGPRSAQSAIQPYKPAEYVQSLPDRSGRILALGLIGCGFVAISLVIVLFVFAGGSLFSSEIMFCFPANLLGLAFTIPAWFMGAEDRKAMRAGAMDRSGWRRTQLGFWSGCFGTLAGAVPFVLVVVAILA